MSEYQLGHKCNLMTQWATEPRSPIKLDKKTGILSVMINAKISLPLMYCPFCGDALCGNDQPIQRQDLCKHLPELANKPKSTVRYRREDSEYWLLGRHSLMIRLFYCPVCGSKLTVEKKDDRFYKQSPKELETLSNRFKSITTIDDAFRQLGPPDLQKGKFEDYIYPQGKRTRIGHKKILFYDQLAKTIKVAVIETLEGDTQVKFYPKEKKSRNG